MVTLWSADFTKPLITASVYIILAVVVLGFYLKVVPRLTEKHWKAKMYLESAIMVIVITDVVSLILTPDLLNHDILYDILQARQISDGAHISSLLMVFSLVGLGVYYWHDWLKALMWGGQLVFRHEAAWFFGYYLAYPQNLNYTVDFGFICWLMSMWYVGRRLYHFKFSRSGYLLFIGYIMGWLANGFQVTVTNRYLPCANIYCPKVLGATQWYGSLQVNGVETVSWLIIWAVALYSLRLNTDPAVKPGMGIPFFSSFRRSLNFGETGKKRLTAVVTVLLLGLAFVSALGLVAPAHAVSNSWTNLTSTTCTTGCTNPVNLSPTLATTGDLVALAVSCDSAASTSHITGITGSKGETWGVATTTTSSPGVQYSYTLFSQSPTDIEIWYAIVGTTGADTVAVTFSNAPSYCVFEIAEDNTISAAYISNLVTATFFTATNGGGSTFTQSLTGTVPANSAVFGISAGYSSDSSSGQAGFYSAGSFGACNSGASPTSGSILGMTTLLWQCYGKTDTGLQSSGSPFSDQANIAGGYVTGSSAAFASSTDGGMTCGSHCTGASWTMTTLVAVFNTSGALPGQSSTFTQVGCTGTKSASNEWNLTANTVYYFPFFLTGNGGQYTLMNMSLWVAASHGGILGFNVYYNSPNPNGQLPTPGNPWRSVNVGGIYWQLPNTVNPVHYSVGNNPATGNGPGVIMTVTPSPTVTAAIGISFFATNGEVKVMTCSTPFTYYADNGGGNQNQLTLAVLPATAAPAFWGWMVSPPVISQQTVTTVLATVTSVVTIAGTSVVTSTQVVNINQTSPTQAPYWFVPLMFWGTCLGVFVEIARRSNAPPKTYMTFSLIGLTLGSVLGAMASVIPFGFTVLFALALVIVIWRSGG